MAVHKLKTAKDDRRIRIEVNQSAMIFRRSGVVVPIGSREYKILSSLVGRGREGENLRDYHSASVACCISP